MWMRQFSPGFTLRVWPALTLAPGYVPTKKININQRRQATRHKQNRKLGQDAYSFDLKRASNTETKELRNIYTDCILHTDKKKNSRGTPNI